MAMTAEIERIGLLSAAVIVASLAAAAVLILGLPLLIGAGLDGDTAWLSPIAAPEPEVAEGQAAAILAAGSVLGIGLLALAVWLVGFAAGLFLAALYNVLASLVGGLRIRLADPAPKEPRRGS